MRYNDFAEFVKERAVFGSDEEAKRTISTVISLLGQRIAPGQAVDIAAVLPPELRSYLMQSPAPEPFRLEAFLSEAGQAGGAGRETAGERVRAVLSVVGEWLPRQELRETLAQLPHEMRGFFEYMKKAA